MIKCEICGMTFTEEIRFTRHFKTHQSKKTKKQKKGMPDYDKPDFSHVM